jgi:hypothetical protein
MSISLTEIKDTQLIKDAPAIIQGNFTAIKNYIDKLENSYNVDNKIIQLIDGLTTQAGGISVKNVQIKSTSGTVFSIQDDTAVRFTILASGKITATAISISNDSEEVSELQKVSIKKESSFSGGLIAKSTLDLRDIDSKLQLKQSLFNVIPSNIGSASTNKISLADKGSRLFLNASNGGNVLGSGDGQALINLGVTDILEGQEIEIFLLITNPVDLVGFINTKPTGLTDGGGSPILEPLFAIITVDGFEDIPSTSTFKHDNSTVASFIKGIWMNIGDNSNPAWRFLVLETKGFVVATV